MGYPQNVLSAVDEYARLGLRTDIENASPHRLILLLLDGAIDKVRIARLAMQRRQIAEKGMNVSWAISIVDGLRASLNIEQGGELAERLDMLYDYMTRTLAEANLRDDSGKLDEVERLLNEIRAGWKGIEDAVEAGAPANNDVGSSALATG